MSVNTILIVASVVIFCVVLIILYMRSKGKVQKIEVDDYNTIDKVLEAVKTEMVNIVREDYSLGLDTAEFDRQYKRKARIQNALKDCVYGIDAAKVLVIDLIRGFIAENVPHERVTELLGLDEAGEPSSHIKYEILMYKYKQRYGKQAMARWLDKNGYANPRIATGAERVQDKAYYITEEDLDNNYYEENFKLNMDEQIDVLATLVYQMYKGFGIIDTVREMDIDGINCGTSGSILSAINKNKDNEFRANSSVWIYYHGCYIHLRFMNFGTEEELRRIIQLIARYNNPGPLTAKRGYLVNTMYDKSRVLALRPPASEYWAVFIRKFTLSDVSPEALLIKPYTTRGDLAVSLIEFLMRGHITCAVTGRQGSGKTTLMSSIIRFIDPRYTIRVLEMAPELYLRELYPTRNILSLQETNTVSAAELQDALKKSDAAVSIVGEVATDSIAARMIQMGMTASIFTIFSHHANTPKDLVLTLRNSLVNAGGFNNMQTAEKQVTDVVKVDIHLDYTPDGKRFIHRISEIIQLDEGVPYPDYDTKDPTNSMNAITTEYYKRQTDRVSFITREILSYDIATHTYHVANRFSPQLEKKLREAMEPELQQAYDLFMLKEWGPRKESDGDPDIGLDVKKAIAQLEAEIGLSEGIINPAVSGHDSLSEADTDESRIIEEAQDKALWAEGYQKAISGDNDDISIGSKLGGVESGFGLGVLMSDEELAKQQERLRIEEEQQRISEQSASLFFTDDGEE